MIESFDEEFARLHARSCKLIETTPAEFLYRDLSARSKDAASQSVGEHVLRSAGAVEQTFGGITSNLWDDPFEWTLPEVLSSPERVIEYLAEVEQTRKHAFGCFAGDGDLLKKVALPSGERRPLINLLLDTFVRAVGYQGRAIAIRATLSNNPPAEYH
jgi:hypothetical protein